jgi:hypothetical protein
VTCPVHGDWPALMHALANLAELDDAAIQATRLRLEPFLTDSDSLVVYLASRGLDAIAETLHARRGADAWCFSQN